MRDSIKQRLIYEINTFKRHGKKYPLLFLSSFIQESINLQWICRLYRKSPSVPYELKNKPKAIYHRFYRLYKRLQKEGLAVLHKPGNDMLFLTATPAFFDLLKQVQNSNFAKTEKKPPFALPQRARPERIDAIKMTLQKDLLTNSDKKLLSDFFEEYTEDITNRVIVLEKLMQEDEYGQRYFFLQYQTRFTSPARKKELLDKYEAVIKKSLSMYKTAVHLVLTTDPKRHKSLWHANRHFGIALNRFFSYLKKKLGYRPSYIAVYEFTKTGLLHCHLLIFGKPYLLDHRIITKEWEKCNQGSYNYIYSLKRTSKGWQYKRKRPKKTKKGQTADDYLMKYLKKAEYDEMTLFLYWVFNKRFFTNSKDLKEATEDQTISIGFFIFVGSFPINAIPAWILEDIPSIQHVIKPIPF